MLPVPEPGSLTISEIVPLVYSAGLGSSGLVAPLAPYSAIPYSAIAKSSNLAGYDV